jgi:hypothetical protein
MGISHEFPMPIYSWWIPFFYGMPRQTPEVSTMSPVVCACVRRWDDGSCRRAAVDQRYQKGEMEKNCLYNYL